MLVATAAVLAIAAMGGWAAAQTDAAAEFYGAQCAGCHGPGGEGGSGPGLVGSSSSVEEIATTIAEGAAGMPGFGDSLDAAALDALAAFVAELQSATPGPPTSAAPLTSGSDIYAAECAGCHGAGGEGGVARELHSLPYTVEDVRAIVRNGVRDMPSFTDRLSVEQMTAVAEFVLDLEEGSTALPPPTAAAASGAAAYTKHCAACHGNEGRGGIGPALVDGTRPVAEIERLTRQGAMHTAVARLADSEIAAIVGFLAPSDAGTAAPTTTAAGGGVTPSAGAELYAQMCASCHGANGLGGSGPSVVPTSLDEAGMAQIIAAGQGTMPGFEASLSADQITAIATYVLDLGGGAAPDEPADGDEAPAPTPAPTGEAAAAAGGGEDDGTAEVDTGPSYWGPLLATVATFAVVTAFLALQRRRKRLNVLEPGQEVTG